MRKRAFLQRTALVLLAVLSPLVLDGCVSIGISRSALESPGAEPPKSGTLEVRIFEKSGDRDRSSVVRYPVFSELFRFEGGSETSVGKSISPTWSAPDLPPGRYELKVTRRINDLGDIEPLRNAGSKVFDLEQGEKVSVDVVLEKVPVLWIVLAAITVVVLIILSIDWARQGKIPVPPFPPVPPVAVFVVTDMRLGGGRHGLEPGVADVFPAKGSVVAARRVTVNFFLTTPLAKDGLEEGAVLALGSRSGAIEGVLSYREEEQLVRFAPARDFTPGETVTVTLDLEKVTSRSGRSGNGKISTSFHVPSRRE